MPAIPNYSPDIVARVDYEDADRRIRELDPTLDVEIFRTAVRYAYSEYASKVTRYSPPTGRGQEMYHHTTSFFREMACSERGWSLDNTDGIASAVSPSGKMRIACLRGGPGTGNMAATPAARRRGKGAVRAYGQSPLPGFEDAAFASDASFWYLLTDIDEQTGTLHAELSCPIIAQDGRIDGWVQRIDLGPFEQRADLGSRYQDVEAPSIDVSRKAV